MQLWTGYTKNEADPSSKKTCQSLYMTVTLENTNPKQTFHHSLFYNSNIFLTLRNYLLIPPSFDNEVKDLSYASYSVLLPFHQH